MKKLYMFLLFCFTVVGTFAVPAKRGLKKTIILADGREVRASLVGDETIHYFVGDDGKKYMADANGRFVVADMTALRARAKERKSKMVASRARKARKRVGGTGNRYEGKKKGLIILAQFSDKPFNSGHDKVFYNRVANEVGFTTDEGFIGSVKDYFKAQSNGIFEMDFDVVGPVTLPKKYSYYGANDTYGDDLHAGEMVAEACLAVDSEVDFSTYDWAGDGEADQVFVLYSGLGEAAGGDDDTVWPHMWELSSSDYKSSLTLDGTIVNTYACSSEMTITEDGDDVKVVTDGIGTICHEFSHCLGLPDMYDTETSNFGMATWDLMDYGSYNGGGHIPSGYTSYEKWFAGWLTPIELTADCTVENQRALSEGGDAYIIYNDKIKDEFYLLENRQQTGWDAALYGSGLLILHVDYDSQVWDNNSVNTKANRQRCTIFHADNSDGDFDYWGEILEDDLAGDPYPYKDNNSLTNSSKPKAILYNENTDGRKLMNKSVTDITRNADGTMSFGFSATAQDNTPVYGEALFRETFNMCTGTGGNDGNWNGNIASSSFIPDMEGWTDTRAYGADQCARFGNGKNPADVTSPEFEATPGAVLTFLAAPWGTDKSDLTVYFNQTVIGEYQLDANDWNEITISTGISGKGTLRFVAGGRLFLDEIAVVDPTVNGIGDVTTSVRPSLSGRVYSIDGRYLGTDIKSLGHGIYIVNGKKIVK